MKVLLVNTYSMENAYKDWKNGITPSHHLWGKIGIERRGKVQIDILPHEKYKIINKLGKFLKIEFLDQQIRSLFLIRKYDAIYAPYGSATTKLLVLLKYLNLVRIPIIALAHQPQFFKHDSHPVKRRIARAAILQYDALVFLSKKMKTDAIENYNIPEEKAKNIFFHIAWGPDVDFYKNYEKRRPVEDTHFAISAGTTSRDFDTIIEAFRGIDFPVKVFTTPNQVPNTTDIPPNVTVHSSGITYKELLKEYDKSRIILIPMKIGSNPTNTLGLTGLLDVLAMGKPTVITENSNLDLDVEKEGIGYWARRYDPIHWRKILNRVLFDEKALSVMGSKASKILREQYNATVFAEGMENIFLKVYAKSRRKR